MEGGNTLSVQLCKLSNIESAESLEHILTTLWDTKKTGLTTSQKSHFQSLLAVPSLADLDPILACLRSIIRKCVHENLTGDDILKLLPPDLSLDLQSILVLSLQKYQNQWKDNISIEQYQLPRTSVSYQVRTSVVPSFQSLASSETSAVLWPRQDNPIARISRSDVGPSAPLLADTRLYSLAPLSIQHDVGPLDNLGILPRLKSMTWTLEKISRPAKRVAIISLKLQEYTKSPSGEMEVKFQITNDTLEAMLRSMTYISEQLSSIAYLSWCVTTRGSPGAPLQVCYGWY